jgi:glycine dehydrogenase
MADLAAEDWDRPYSRMVAAFPAPGQTGAKYWPPVNRVDNVYGDRHLVCSCPPLDSYKDAAE